MALDLGVVTLLPDLLEELLAEHGEDVQLLRLVGNDLVDALGLHIDGLAHVNLKIEF